MMLPSAAPMIATFGYDLDRVFACRNRAAMDVASLGLVTPTAESASPVLTSGLLAIAGLYQFSPLKYVCRRYCRSLIGFLLMEWRPGASGAWAMGLKHSTYRLGCCWAVMLLLFVVGAMNLAWIVVLIAIVAAEKLIPPTTWMTGAIGGLFLWASVLDARSAITRNYSKLAGREG
jgi:predicted metal-binding membrane protein